MTETATAEPDQAEEHDHVADIKVGGEEIEGLDGEVTSKGLQTFRSNGKGMLTIDPDQHEWTPTQVTALSSIGIQTSGEDAVPQPFVLQFLHTCQAADLDPFRREAYLIVHGKRWWSRQDNAWVDNRKYTLVTGIDGFRKKAEDTGQYRGQVGPQWLTAEGQWVDFWLPKWGHPEAARVGILRSGFDAPVWGVAMYDEFVATIDETTGTGRNKQKTGNKVPNSMWATMPANQLAKCAEAQGHRKAFPRQMRGMYETSEMQRAQAQYEDQQRDERRLALARARADARSGSTQPQKAGEVAAEVVQGMTVTQDAPETPQGAQEEPQQPARPLRSTEELVALLVRELHWQADALGHPVESLAKRALAAAGTDSIEALPPKVLGPLVVNMRQVVADAIAREDTDLGEQYAAYVGKEEPVDVDALFGGEGDSETPEGQTAPEAEVDPSEPHRFEDKGDDTCKHCQAVEDQPWHT